MPLSTACVKAHNPSSPLSTRMSLLAGQATGLRYREIAQRFNDGGKRDDKQRYAIHAAFFAALANPTRHELMHLPCGGARAPSDLADLLGVSRTNVSQPLALLQREGLVKRTRQTSRVLWEIVDPRLACRLPPRPPTIRHKHRRLTPTGEAR